MYVSVSNTQFINNYSRDINPGGAIYVQGVNLKVWSSKFMNNTASSGGAIYARHSIVHIDDTIFEENSATGLNPDEGGSAIHFVTTGLKVRNCSFKSNYNHASSRAALFSDSSHFDIINCHFIQNRGGAIGIDYGLIVIGPTITFQMYNNTFRENYAEGNGGAIYSNNGPDGVVITIYIYNSVFESNCAANSGGAIYFGEGVIVLHETVFLNNSANELGGAIFCKGVSGNNCQFEKNNAGSGGAIVGSHLHFNYTIFQENLADTFGGALVVSEKLLIDQCHFINNSAVSSGGALLIKNLFFISHAVFKDNKADVSGGAILCGRSYSKGAATEVKVISNKDEYGGGVYAKNCDFIISSTTDPQPLRNNIIFAYNMGTSRGGAIFAVNSSIMVLKHAAVLFTNNAAMNEGGGIFMNNSHITIYSKSHLSFSHNEVTSLKGRGGAIFVQDDNVCKSLEYSYSQCFITGSTTDRNNSMTLNFINNTAAIGPVLYGGLLDICYPDTTSKVHLLGIDFFKQISQYEWSPLAISSDPARVCICSNPKLDINCTQRELAATKMRGGTIDLLLVIIDQDSNPKASKIQALYKEPLAELAAGEHKRKINRLCTRLSYHIFTVESTATLILRAEGIKFCEQSPFSNITVHVKLQNCSRGFELSIDNDRCICDRRLALYFTDSVVCDVQSQTLNRKGSSWLRYDEKHLKLRTHCPLDYCEVNSDTISLLFPDKQCANHRTGVICGACQDNYSIALGNSKC